MRTQHGTIPDYFVLLLVAWLLNPLRRRGRARVPVSRHNGCRGCQVSRYGYRIAGSATRRLLVARGSSGALSG